MVLIGLDDPSLDELHEPVIHVSPKLAEVVTYARGQGAAAFGVDLIVPESLAGMEELQEGKSGDATTLGKAIRDAGDVVLPSANWKTVGCGHCPSGASNRFWRRGLATWASSI